MAKCRGSPSLGHGSIFIGGRDYNLYAISSIGGYANWNRKFQAGWALSTTVEDTVLYVGTSDDRLLLALDARTGHELWKTNVKFNIFGGCAFTTGMVYVGSIWGKLFGIDKKTGAIRWAFDTDGYTTNHLKYFKSDDTFRMTLAPFYVHPSNGLEQNIRWGESFPHLLSQEIQS
jgi:outer membrane protein assembly factor BamB